MSKKIITRYLQKDVKIEFFITIFSKTILVNTLTSLH